MRPGCTHALVGWKRSTTQLPFMSMVIADAAPSIPEPPDGTLEHNVAPCGMRMVMLHPGSFCSMCYECAESGARLSDGEVLCIVCTCSVVEAGSILPAARAARAAGVSARLYIEYLNSVDDASLSA